MIFWIKLKKVSSFYPVLNVRGGTKTRLAWRPITHVTSGSKPLEIIRDAQRNVQQRFAEQKNQADLVGFRKGDVEPLFFKLLTYLSILWVSGSALRRAVHLYCEDIPSSNGFLNKTEGSSCERTAASSKPLLERLAFWLMSRGVGHLAPPFQDVWIRSGGADVLIAQLHDTFTAPHARQHQLERLHQLTTRKQLCVQLLERIRSLTYAEQQPLVQPARRNASDKGTAESTNLTLLQGLFFGNGSFEKIPEDVDSVLCRGFWPLLRLLVTPGNLTWGDLYRAACYPGYDDESAQLPFTDMHLRTPLLMYIVLDLVSACPPSEREVPFAFLQALLSTNPEFWSQPFRREDYRAHILRLLLENHNNALKVLAAEGQQRLQQRDDGLWDYNLPHDPPEKDTTRRRLVLDYLYAPFVEQQSTASASHQVQGTAFDDIRSPAYLALVNINQAAREQQRDDAARAQRLQLLALPSLKPGQRLTHLQHSLRYRHYSTSFSLGLLTAAVITLFCAPQTMSPVALAQYWLKTGVGSLALEILYTLQEKCLSHIPYGQSLGTSELLTLTYVPLNAFLWSTVASRYALPSFGTFLYHRAGSDSLTDAFREV